MKENINNKRTKSSLWLFASGIIIIGLGIYIWSNPAEALLALALYIGIILIISGIAYGSLFLISKSSVYLTIALLNILVGIILILNLGVTAASLPVMFAFWSLFIGVIQITSAYNSFHKYQAWGLPALSGILGIIFAFLIISHPLIGTIAITVLMGLYMVLYGSLGVAECTTCLRRDYDDDIEDIKNLKIK